MHQVDVRCFSQSYRGVTTDSYTYWTTSEANWSYHFTRTLPDGEWQQVSYSQVSDWAHGYYDSGGVSQLIDSSHFTSSTGTAGSWYAPPVMGMALPSFSYTQDILESGALDVLPAPQSPYIQTGDTEDGGTWEFYDDGNFWYYKEWNAQGELVEDVQGYHHKTATDGLTDSTDDLDGAQEQTEPLEFPEGAPSPESVQEDLESGHGDNPFRDSESGLTGHWPHEVYRPELDTGLGHELPPHAVLPVPTFIKTSAKGHGVTMQAADAPVIIADTNGDVVYADEEAKRGIGDWFLDQFSLDSEAEAYRRRGYKVTVIPGASQMSQEELEALAEELRNGRETTPTPTPKQVTPKPPPVPKGTFVPAPAPVPQSEPSLPTVTDGYWNDKPGWLVDLVAGTSGDWLEWMMTEDTSFGEALIPIWGPLRQALADFSDGEYVWGTMNVGFAVLDGSGLGYLFRNGSRVLRYSIPPLRKRLVADLTKKFGDMGFDLQDAGRLARRYAGKGHHFPIPSGSTLYKNLPKWIGDSPFNVLKPPGLSKGEFYALHFLVDTSWHGTSIRKGISAWSGNLLGLPRASRLDRIWLGLPPALKTSIYLPFRIVLSIGSEGDE